MHLTPARNKFGGWFVMLILFVSASHALAATPAPAQGTSLAWDPSPDSNVIGYNVYYGTTSGDYSSMTSVQNITSTTISNLTAGKTYYFAVTAFDANGVESTFSNEIQFIVPGVLTFSKGANPGDPMLIKFPVAPSQSYEVQATSDFQSWATIWQTGVATSNAWVQFSDAQASEISSRFYRLVLR
jgi:hypothetical protein